MPPSLTDSGSALEDGYLEGDTTPEDELESGADLTDKEWIQLFKSALTASADYQDTKLRQQWSRNYRAFQSRHPSGTKYDTAKYRNRSKLFKPKTRMAVRKNDAAAAAALFSTSDAVSITATRSSDVIQAKGAAVVHSCLNYRLDRDDPKAGPSWFLTSVGAHQDAQVAGVCVSKQYWEYETYEIPDVVEEPVFDELSGLPMPDPLTGQPQVKMVDTMKKIVRRDRIMIENIPPEQGFCDPTADWRNPVQEGGYFIAGYPIRDNDLESWIAKESKRNRMGGGKWRDDLDLKKIRGAGRSNQLRNSQTVRISREDGVDRYESRHTDKNSDIMWLYEVFYRFNGEDWCFWMLGETIMLSDPVPTLDAYPEQGGARPYVRGVGAIESHKVYPAAPVETWQQLQQEMNENTNLTLDARKMSISPITVVRRGKNIDLKQVQNRGPDAVVMVDSTDDLDFAKAPGPDGGAQLDMNNLNVDFDELAGVFSPSSVQTNRQLNETVGGMQMMQGGSNSITEFDLRVWVETWVEPVLRQCANLIRYYESDAMILGIAGEEAGLLIGGSQPKPKGGLSAPDPREQASEPQISITEVMQAFDDLPLKVRCDVGIGSMDTKQKLEKFSIATKMTMEMMPLAQRDGIVPDTPAMLNELWGLNGYKDGGDKFFKRMDPSQMPKNPEAEAAKAEEMAKQAEFKRKQKADEDEQARKAEEHRWKQEDRILETVVRGREEKAKGEQDLATRKGEAEAKRTEAGLPGDEMYGMMVEEMRAARMESQTMMREMVTAFANAISQMSQTQQQGNQMLAEAITQPRTVRTPDGREFTANVGGRGTVQ